MDQEKALSLLGTPNPLSRSWDDCWQEQRVTEGQSKKTKRREERREEKRRKEKSNQFLSVLLPVCEEWKPWKRSCIGLQDMVA